MKEAKESGIYEIDPGRKEMCEGARTGGWPNRLGLLEVRRKVEHLETAQIEER